MRLISGNKLKKEEDFKVSICFSTTNSWVSKAIRVATRSDISHCYLRYKDFYLGKNMVMESEWGGYRILPWDSPLRNNTELVHRYTLNVPETIQIQALSELTMYLGTSYAYKSLIPLAAKAIKRTLARPIMSPARLICSESVIMFINKCNTEKLSEPHKWSPEDVFSYVNSHPELFNKESK